LAEIGVIGLLGFLLILAGSLVILFTKYKFNQPLFLPVILSVITAFAVQYLFFGSYINVVYIWLWLGIASGLASLSQKQLSNLIK
jgi:cell division protein FtsW (lipid II flippase)